MNTSVLIIGGGLSGLVTAYELTKRGIQFHLIEARNRFGGRILSQALLDEASDHISAVDMGPSWFWPGQHNMAKLIKELDLGNSVFLQSGAGYSVVEYQDGKIEKVQGNAAMADSNRLEGGMSSMIVKLIDRLPPASLMSNGVATTLTRTDVGISTNVTFKGESQLIASRHVVLALPPRLIAQSLAFVPRLPDSTYNRFNSSATWMAGQAKIVAVYAQPFWRDQGLSGDAFSHRGPLVEIHDASPIAGGPYALFGFVGVPAQYRQGRSAALKEAAVEQLVRLFGEPANIPVSLYLQDWAFEQFTSTIADRTSHNGHSKEANHPITEWDKRIVWSGSERAEGHSQSNGYLEGAVESGLRAAEILTDIDSTGKVACSV